MDEANPVFHFSTILMNTYASSLQAQSMDRPSDHDGSICFLARALNMGFLFLFLLFFLKLRKSYSQLVLIKVGFFFFKSVFGDFPIGLND